MTDQIPVVTKHLCKRYRDVVAVDNADLLVEPGDVFGFLGPNGAGKTTLLRMLLGLIRPDSGSAMLFGRDPMRDGVRALDGVAGFVEAPRFYPYLSGRTNLELVAALDGGDAARRIDAALAMVEMQDRARHRVGGYSHGMRQRLGIAAAMIRSPRLLLLDEPSTGLDPAGMRDMRLLVRRLAADGITVVLSSHVLAEVEELCNRVAVINHGSIIYQGSLQDLRGTTSPSIGVATSDDDAAIRILQAAPGVRHVTMTPAGLVVDADAETTATLSLLLASEAIAVTAMSPLTPTLEEIFLRLTDRSAQPSEAPGCVATQVPA